MKELSLYSNFRLARHNAKHYLGDLFDDGNFRESTRKDKKYMVFDPNTSRWVHFGQMGYEDYTKHHDEKRRHYYLSRSHGIIGNWRNNIFSPNNLSRYILWDA